MCEAQAQSWQCGGLVHEGLLGAHMHMSINWVCYWEKEEISGCVMVFHTAEADSLIVLQSPLL